MARIRSVKPEFWRDAKVLKLSEGAMLLFIGSWNLCDDEGRMVWDPEQVQVDLFSSKPHLDLEKLAAELVAQRMVVLYEAAGVRYYAVRNFSKHQKIDKRTPSRLPPPPSSPEFPREAAKTAESPKPPTQEGKGVERTGSGNGQEQAISTKGTRFRPVPMPDEWRAVAKEMRPDLNADEVYKTFSDHWIAKSGHWGVKLDWLATWRNWLRKEAAPRGGSRPPGTKDYGHTGKI